MDYLAEIATHAEAVAAAARHDPDAPVPPCPGWDVTRLAGHLGTAHRRWEAVVRTRATGPVTVEETPPGAPEVAGWVLEGAESLRRTLAAADPSTPVWSWAGTVPASWVIRRMAHETLVHRWDAGAAVGAEPALPADLAADGVDEFLDVFLAHRTDGPLERRVRVHLHRTDGPGEWLIDAGPEGLRVERGHERGDAAVRASAQDLLLLLWRRRAVEDVEVHGDADALRALLAWPRL